MGVDATDRVGVDAAIAAVEETMEPDLPPVLVCFEHGPPVPGAPQLSVGLDAEAIGGASTGRRRPAAR
jgi:hypothetical protein